MIERHYFKDQVCIPVMATTAQPYLHWHSA
jgi:hypothetical protein